MRHLNKDEIEHNSCFHDVTERCLRGQNSFKEPLSPPDYRLWKAMKGVVYKDNSRTLLELKEATKNSIRNIPSDGIAACLCVSKSNWEHFQHLL
jgi:hypothetical protein